MFFPHTASRRIRLRPATTADQANFFLTVLKSGIGSSRQTARPTLGAAKPSAAFLVLLRSREEVLGFSALHGLDPAGHVRLGVYLDPQRARHGVGSEAILLSVNYAFATMNVEKVITQTTAASFAQLGLYATHGGRIGALPEHAYFRGQYWDLHTFEISRQDWENYVDKDMDGVLPPALGWRTDPTVPQMEATEKVGWFRRLFAR